MMSGARESGHCCVVFCLIFLLMDISSTDAAQTPTTMNHYNLLHAHIPKISQWFQHLGLLLHRYGDHLYYQNTFEVATQHILHHLRSSVTILVGATGVRSVLRVVAANKRRKCGRKSAEEKRAYDEMVQIMLIGLFQDRECQPLQSYLAAHNMEFMCWKLRKIIYSNERLKYIMS